MPIIERCFFEEEPGFPINNYDLCGGNNGQIGIVGYPGNIYAYRIRDVIMNMGISGAGNGFNVPGATGHNIVINPAVGGTAHGIIDGCEFVLSTARGYIQNGDPDLTIGPCNKVEPTFPLLSTGSIVPTQTYGGG